MAAVVSDIINVFSSPRDVFMDLKANPKWLAAFMIISIVSIICGYFLFPFLQIVMDASLPANINDEQVEHAQSMMKGFRIIGLFLGLIPLIIKWLFISALLYYGAILLNSEQIGFKSVFSAVVYSEFILLMMSIFNLLILYIKGTDSINTAVDLNAIVGLDFFMTDKSTNLPLFTLLNNINLFSIWYVTVLAVGIYTIAGLSKAKSVILASSVWLVLLGIQVAFAVLSERFQGMMGG
ncbi:MAG: YIP1 family protein [Bacteroidetes bacterium]|nr:YIP1 family protein [Bacteroidota bacterium]